jgi:predicted metal-dependent hydrolase
LRTGSLLPYLGRQLLLDVRPGQGPPAVQAGFDRLEARLPGGDATALTRLVEDWYRRQAECHIRERVDHWSRTMGLQASALQIRAQRRRWGSCSPSGALRFNWRLVMAPPELVDYVVVHELVHLRHLNHSPAFHQEVARWLPEAKALRARLRAEGALYQGALRSG